MSFVLRILENAKEGMSSLESGGGRSRQGWLTITTAKVAIRSISRERGRDNLRPPGDHTAVRYLPRVAALTLDFLLLPFVNDQINAVVGQPMSAQAAVSVGIELAPRMRALESCL